MDPISALSIAASVVAFIDFANKILKSAAAFRDDGQSLTRDDYENTLSDLSNWEQVLKGQAGGKISADAIIAAHEQVSRAYLADLEYDSTDKATS
jgi:hypothetical protein